MPVKLVVAVTDRAWFDQLSALPDLDEVNFWAPGGASFRALGQGELFLFKLHAPNNFIVGGGVFAYSNTLPCSLAWQAFGEKNGARSLAEMRARIARYRKTDPRSRDDFEIGCRILTQPFFFTNFASRSVGASRKSSRTDATITRYTAARLRRPCASSTAQKSLRSNGTTSSAFAVSVRPATSRSGKSITKCK